MAKPKGTIGSRGRLERKETATEQYDKLPRSARKNMGPRTRAIVGHPIPPKPRTVKA